MTDPVAAATTLPELLDWHAREQPDGLAVIWDEGRQTFGELRGAVRSAASGLRRLGLKPGDRFTIYMSNCPDFVHAWLAGLYIGVQPVGINVAYRGSFLRHQIVNSCSKVVMTSPELLGEVEAVAGECPDVEHVLVADVDPSWPLSEVANVFVDVSVHRTVDVFGGEIDEPESVVAPGGAAAVLYTSGTTGLSKGAVMSQGYLLHVARVIGRRLGLGPGVATHNCLPMFHMGGLRGIMEAVCWGSTVAYERRFSASRLMEQVRRHRAHAMTIVPTQLAMVWAQPALANDADNSLTKLLVSPWVVPPEKVAARFGLEETLVMYGMTEALPVSFGDTMSAPKGSSGRPIDDLEVRVITEAGVPLPVNEVGEIVIRSKSPFAMLTRYLPLPDRDPNVDSFRDGWFHTGDLGRIDSEGFLFWVDRKQDYLRRKGENISSYELEMAIMANSAVREAAVHAVPGDLGDEEIRAVMILEPGATIEYAELHLELKQRLPKFAVPRYLEFVSELPRNPTGKVRKPDLRATGVTESTWDASGSETSR